MKLPNDAELYAAKERYGKDGPQPLAEVIDQNEWLSTYVDMLAGMLIGEHPLLSQQDALKTMLVLGLNLGIRIGEARSK